MAEVLVGRQPIYKRQLDVFAYELLFRNGHDHSETDVDGDQATALVFLNTFIEIGLEQIVGKYPAFINLTRSFIIGNYCLSLPTDRVVLEVLENIVPDEEVLAALSALSAQGYRIALDDFIYHENLRPLVDLADIVKLDVLALDRDTLKEHVAILKELDLELLAEKIESYEDFEFCNCLGFDYFQGHFFCRPKVISGPQLPVNRLATLRLLAKLQKPDVEAHELEETIRLDPSLSYKLLRFVNSAFCALPRRVDSLREAAMFVGTQRIRIWASLIMLATMEDKPRELMVTAIVRARMCEQLASALRQENRDRFFTVGLLSLLDAMLDCPMPEILDMLPLSEEINSALVRQAGLLGDVLRCVLAYERGNWEDVGCLNLDPEPIRTAYLMAVAWTETIISELATGG